MPKLLCIPLGFVVSPQPCWKKMLLWFLENVHFFFSWTLKVGTHYIQYNQSVYIYIIYLYNGNKNHSRHCIIIYVTSILISFFSPSALGQLLSIWDPRITISNLAGHSTVKMWVRFLPVFASWFSWNSHRELISRSTPKSIVVLMIRICFNHQLIYHIQYMCFTTLTPICLITKKVPKIFHESVSSLTSLQSSHLNNSYNRTSVQHYL